MRLVFMGSSAFALPSLKALLSSRHALEALVTQPDKPAGRGHGLRMPATKKLALSAGLPVHQPSKVRAPESVELLRELAPQCIVVVAYGQIIPKAILEIPPKGIINVHGSLLPAYRGAAPVQWAIAHCETTTGVTTMLMDEGLDTGPILLQDSLAIAPDDTGGRLEPKLAEAGANLLLATLDRWEQGELEPIPQDDAKATHAPRIRKEDGRIDWSLSAREIACRVRAFDPWPVAFTELEDVGALRIWKARSQPGGEQIEPGRVVECAESGITVACGNRTRLLIEEVQAPGKSRMPAAAFARGRRLRPGTRLGRLEGSQP